MNEPNLKFYSADYNLWRAPYSEEMSPSFFLHVIIGAENEEEALEIAKNYKLDWDMLEKRTGELGCRAGGALSKEISRDRLKELIAIFDNSDKNSYSLADIASPLTREGLEKILGEEK